MSGLIKGLTITYSYINILSIDVVIGACIMALFVGNIVGVSVAIPVVFSLAITVWLIYTIDHLIDASSIKHTSHTRRHQFHQRFNRKIKFAVWLILPVQILLLIFLPWSTLKGGTLLMLVVMLYFTVLWSFKVKNIYHKEIIIAILYTAGIFLPVWEGLASFNEFLMLLYFQILGLAFSNLLMFSLLEMASDKLDNQRSLALVIGKPKTTKIVHSILILGIVLSIFMAISSSSPIFRNAQIIIMMMNFVLMLILASRILRKGERFRYLGDGIFYLPLLHLLSQ